MQTITQMNHKGQISVEALCDALLVPRATYYRHEREKTVTTTLEEKRPQPKNSLSEEEKQQVLDLLHSERFIDKTPYDAFNAMLDEGEYHCSPRTMYRLLAAQGENKDRRQQRCHRDAVKPELIASMPNEVWSWDITKLRTTQKWVYLYLYVIIDILAWFKMVLFWVAKRVTKPTNRWYKPQLHCSSLKTQYYFYAARLKRLNPRSSNQ
jgi:putative transposase